jgi:hypothetical protein
VEAVVVDWSVVVVCCSFMVEALADVEGWEVVEVAEGSVDWVEVVAAGPVERVSLVAEVVLAEAGVSLPALASTEPVRSLVVLVESVLEAVVFEQESETMETLSTLML